MEVQIGSRPFFLVCEHCGHEYDTRKPHICFSFTGWLKKQSARDDIIGDLAQAQQVDECWPHDNPPLEEFHNHLNFHEGTIDGAHVALDRAWQEWQGLLGGRNGTHSPDISSEQNIGDA